ncbi:DUF1993 domain-containing protein [Tsuneonella sp. CC-YZS046]|uniref:DUF1993 domain-containing protein n=1 Tax=Tsuneonella sp. CC-YZS046 TaxID=3042152 RepID=UPI002D7701AA|nr:DUF1993 domain-containing protein [Tsuneonella sp. CC-YZS046]WRO67053.1 DUF1993 domain-containing protein [Tsuneonella sp. CC-YZS046]
MPISLYDAFVPSCLQLLGSVGGLIDKAEAHCSSGGCAPDDLIGGRLYEDMLDFAYQVKSCAVHSAGAIQGVREGQFSPDMSEPPNTFEGLKHRLATAISALEAVSEEEIEGFLGKDMHFIIPGRIDRPFTAENFLLSFSQPNFYFHATTAYGILRMKGLKIGKIDYLGAMRISA